MGVMEFCGATTRRRRRRRMSCHEHGGRGMLLDVGAKEFEGVGREARERGRDEASEERKRRMRMRQRGSGSPG